MRRLFPLALAFAALSCGGENEDTWYPMADASNTDASQDAGLDAASDVSKDVQADAGEDVVSEATMPLDVTSEPIPDATPDVSGPSVVFVAPNNNGTVSNPVVFQIKASKVDEVEIFADESYSLGAAWNPAQRDTLMYRFAGTGQARNLHVTGRVGGVDVARDDLVITVKPDSCEDRFFVTKFDANNKTSDDSIDIVTIREEALAALKEEVAALQACGAGVTLGGMMSLIFFEGLFRVCAFNTRCSENSYHPSSSNCDVHPEALYSYQFGLGVMHTSNFHPCKGAPYTANMRKAFLDSAAAAGFDTSDSLLTSDMIARVHQFCPSATANAVDFYLLGAHTVFDIPRNTAGNHFPAYGKFPLFSPTASLRLMFRMLTGSCSNIKNDRDAIKVFGGGDSSYGQTSKQNTILAHYENFKAANCN